MKTDDDYKTLVKVRISKRRKWISDLLGVAAVLFIIGIIAVFFASLEAWFGE